MILSLPILFDKVDQEDESCLLDCDTVEVTFFRIDAIVPFFEDGIDYCEIYSGGARFMSAVDYPTLKQLISEKSYNFS